MRTTCTGDVILDQPYETWDAKGAVLHGRVIVAAPHVTLKNVVIAGR